ncbi:MAG: hypothetical protein AAF598_12285, partial [Bacteroidota bacterium]
AMVNIQKVSTSTNDNTISVKSSTLRNKERQTKRSDFRVVNHLITYFMFLPLWLHKLSLPFFALKKHIHANWERPFVPLGSFVLLSGTILLLGSAPISELELPLVLGPADVPSPPGELVMVVEHEEVLIESFIEAHQGICQQVASVYGIPEALIMAQAIYHYDQPKLQRSGIRFPEWNSSEQELTQTIRSFPMNRESWDAKALQIMDNGGTVLQEKFGKDPIKWALGLDYLHFSGTPAYGKKLLLIMKRYQLASSL